MDVSHPLKSEPFYLTTLISLIFAGKRHPYTEEDRSWLENVKENNRPVPDLGYTEDPTTEEVEEVPLIREKEFEVELASADKEVVLNSLKRNALDRLAEILARFKTDRMAQLKGEANETKNLDAKHVASTTMIEDKKGGRVMILCSKNNGIDSLDQEFLANLKEKLEYISKGGMLSIV